MGRKGLPAMTIPDYVAFGVLIVLFVLNVIAVVADRKQGVSGPNKCTSNRFVSRN